MSTITLEVKKIAAAYPRVVKWSEEDGCFIGALPELCFGGFCCHGDEPREVYTQLEEIAEDLIGELLNEGKEIPRPSLKAIEALKR